MFFQQSHNARNAADEADENEIGSYYLETPPWAHPGKKRFSTVSGMSSRSRRTTVGSSGGTDQMSHSRSGSLESTPPLRDASNILPIGPGLYLRQASMARSSMAQGRPSFSKPTGNPAWRFIKRVMSSSFGLFLFIQSYLCIGAFCFMWMEAAREVEQWNLMESLRHNLSAELNTCSGNETCHVNLLKIWEQKLVRFPPIYLEIQEGRVWSWIHSYYCSFTIISTIGYGNVTPLSPLGRMFAIVYAVVGIPLMLLFITDIGNKFARWTKIAVIAFRKGKYIFCQRCKRRKKKKGEDADSKDSRCEDDDAEDKNNETSGRGTPHISDVVNTRFNIPEVHINIAMSTLDEESCEADTTRVDREVEMRGTKDYAKYGLGSLYLEQQQQANSEYGGSSTGCFNEAHQDTEPHGSDKDTHLIATAPQTTEVPFGGTGDQSVSECGEITKPGVDLNYDDSVSAADDDVFVYQNLSPEEDAVCPNRTPEDDTAMNGRQGTEFLAAEIAGNPAVDCEEITVVVDGSLEEENPVRTVDISETIVSPDGTREGSDVHEIVVDSMKCEKCGQYLQSEHVVDASVDNGRPTAVGSSRRKRRKGMVDKMPNTHAVLSRSKSKSLEEIYCLRNSTGRESNRPSVMRGGTDRRTSAPGVVSFRAQPVRQNGRLPNHIQERTRNDSSDLDHELRHTDYDREYRDRAATDSGVASSSSNSTECSPKRQPYSVSVDVAGGETMDSGDSVDDDDVVSDDDVMDSDEEKKMSRFRQRSGVADRRSTIGEFARISEADIAMLSIPIWLALLLLLIYLIFGAGCFAAMQMWTFLDGFYYCFISLSTIGFGDLVFLPQNLHAGLIFSFLYSFFGLCFTSMCMSLSSLELTLLSRKISAKFGVYSARVRLRSVRWKSRRRRAVRGPSPDPR
ncbi:uncharacterized protein [Asterias amurensis]|uniref:uncharacterized protein n=1 Tax=Asterias amurensis TaxID=7602 RepID=UPI003AB528D8